MNIHEYQAKELLAKFGVAVPAGLENAAVCDESRKIAASLVEGEKRAIFLGNVAEQHPQAAVLCYVNTSAEVKAECDMCCTSANARNMGPRST